MQLQVGDAVGDGVLGAGQKARADAVGDRAEPQIEARGLDLVGIERRAGDDGARRLQRLDEAGGEDAGGPECRCAHGPAPFLPPGHSRESGNPSSVRRIHRWIGDQG